MRPLSLGLAAAAISSKTGTTASIDGNSARAAKSGSSAKTPRQASFRARPYNINVREAGHPRSIPAVTGNTISEVVHNRSGIAVPCVGDGREPHGRPHAVEHGVHPSWRDEHVVDAHVVDANLSKTELKARATRFWQESARVSGHTLHQQHVGHISG